MRTPRRLATLALAASAGLPLAACSTTVEAEPGAGVPGDEGLCQAVAGWYGYVGLSLLATDESGQVDPADVVPLLEALRDAPQGHQDAGGAVLDAAAGVSDATDEVIGELESGADAHSAVGILDQPITDFATACSSADVGGAGSTGPHSTGSHTL